MVEFIAYPQTNQFRQIVADLAKQKEEDLVTSLPTLKFTGTVKLHGTNAAIIYRKTFDHWCQSRNRILTNQLDNEDFRRSMQPIARTFFNNCVLAQCPIVQKYYDEDYIIAIYGEWCGSNIQKRANIAIAALPKMFVIFKIRIICPQKTTKCKEKDFWIEPSQWKNIKWHEKRIYNIYDFNCYEIDIDFNQPELVQDRLTQLTDEVERRCPIGAYFNRFGCGEGIVWTEWTQTSGTLAFKVKGRQHAIVNSRILVPVSVVQVQVDNINEFVEYACTNNRMEQTYDWIKHEQGRIESKTFNDFVRWLAEDIIKEEKDTMNKANIHPKNVLNAITSKAQIWFNSQLANDHRMNKKQKTID